MVKLPKNLISAKKNVSDVCFANSRPLHNSNVAKVFIVKLFQKWIFGPKVSFLAYPIFWKIAVFNANF